MNRTAVAPRAWLGHGEAAVAMVAGIVLLLLLLFVVWPVAKVLWMSVAGPAGLTSP